MIKHSLAQKNPFPTDRSVFKRANQKYHINKIQFQFPFRWAWRHDDVLSWSKGENLIRLSLQCLFDQRGLRRNRIRSTFSSPTDQIPFESKINLAHFYNFMKCAFLGKQIHMTFIRIGRSVTCELEWIRCWKFFRLMNIHVATWWWKAHR